METLKITKRILKSKITRLENKLKTQGDWDIDSINRQTEILESEINDLHRQILTLSTTESDQTKAEKEFFEALDKIDDIRKIVRQVTPSAANNQQEKPAVSINLPRIELPVFSGDFNEWLSFKDIFDSTIIQNQALSDLQKLQYLKVCIKEEAALLIQAVPIINENFKIAWTLVCDRYDNHSEILTAVLDKLLLQPPITTESASALRKLLDVTNQCLYNLESLQQPVKQWDSILIHLLRKKLDPETLRQWVLLSSSFKSLNEKRGIPSFEVFRQFLEERARGIAALPFVHSKQVNPDRSKSISVSKQFQPRVLSYPSTPNGCKICSSSQHFIYKCEQFLRLSAKDKKDIVKKNHLCFNCLRSNHSSKDCRSSRCKKCNLPHNTLLHEEWDQAEVPVSTHSASLQQSKTNQVTLLPTAIVNIVDLHGQPQQCRVLIDSGSQTSFIREDCVQRLKLSRRKAHVNVSGISCAGLVPARGVVNFRILSPLCDALSVDALILSKITGELPQTKVDIKELERFKSVKLADNQCHIPGPIDVLLGADVFHRVLLPGRLTSADQSISAIESIFGWIITGKIKSSSSYHHANVFTHLVQCNVPSFELQRFWELEEVPLNVKYFTPQEQACEDHFLATYSRNEDGRFVVKLPFHNNGRDLGSSKELAARRLIQTEKRFKHHPQKFELYKDFMKQYENLNHMKQVNSSGKGLYYLPHHAVMKSTQDTKFRVVFDASAKSTNGVSLNDKLMVGPTIQDDIATILLRFQKHKIALTADIVKMYRQILIHPDDHDYQRILWRESPEDQLKEFVLLTVTYGTASAPYLATRALQQLAIEECTRFPEASSVVKQDFYVDDLITGADTLEEAVHLQKELQQLLMQGGCDLRKWSSNEDQVLKHLPDEFRSISSKILDGEVKTLGVLWNPGADVFYFKVHVIQDKAPYTKRSVLSNISKLFDPLGWISPIVIRFKLFIQDMWKMNITWDDQLPEESTNRWKDFMQDLNNLEQIRISRYALQPDWEVTELHGFSDASERAYSAVVYIRTTSSTGNSKVKLLTSKTRVAPIKHTTLPRLELCGAVLLAKLVKFTKQSLKLSSCETFCWTDSTIVLAWLSSHPSRWKTFVAHRISQIKETLPEAHWNHIEGTSNPADCASRGCSALKLNTFSLWWEGPEFLSTKQKVPSEQAEYTETKEVLVEERKIKSTISHHTKLNTSTECDLLHRFSSLTKLQRITAYVVRFLRNCRLPPDQRRLDFITSDELKYSLHLLVKKVQQEEFKLDLDNLRKSGSVSSKSNLLPLTPFLDDDGIIRVGGRLHHSNLSEHKKHPIVLPKRHYFTNLVVLHFHLINLHAGPQLLQSCLQLEFWIPGARNVVRQLVRKCVTCARHQPQFIKPLMGDLPAARVIPSRPFVQCGVDYAGPFLLRLNKGSRTQSKAYLALFVCFTTKAVHCELVSDLSTNAFLACLKRMIARRGKPSDIYSDCGTNFVGANRELKELYKLFRSTNHNNSVSNSLSNEGIRWHFNPPASPHMGGLWEASIKSVKNHLRRIASNVTLTFEELYTLIVQIEACLNSRPLCPLSNDPNDFAVLTPGHFLIGGPLSALPDPDFTNSKLNRLTRWQLVQRLLQHFWKRWNSEYLVHLQKRSKWNKKGVGCKIGDLVLIKEDGISPLNWKLGRIDETHPGVDGVVRVVKIKTANGYFTRSVHKVGILPVND